MAQSLPSIIRSSVGLSSQVADMKWLMPLQCAEMEGSSSKDKTSQLCQLLASLTQTIKKQAF